MPLYEVSEQNKHLELVKPVTFGDILWRERQDLQASLRDNSHVIAPDILVVAEEYSNWQESLRRVDLLALDKDCNLVVIELKRVEEAGHSELQAIRYAAMLSSMDFDSVVRAFEKFLSNPDIALKRGISASDARQHILNFLEIPDAEEVTISTTPRVLLLAPSFSKEITTTVLWLNDHGLDLRCIEVNPYRIKDDIYLNVEQVIPLPSADSYIVQQRVKAIKAQIRRGGPPRERTIPLLMAQGILQSGVTRLHLIKSPRPGLEINDPAAKGALFIDERKIEWDYDHNIYSLSDLCRKVCEQFGGAIGAGAFRGPDFWAVEGEAISLTARSQTVNSIPATESVSFSADTSA